MRKYHTFILSIMTLGAVAQTKTEFEKRIPTDSFPKAAQMLVKQLPKNVKKQQCFKEFSKETISYEIKLLYNGRHFSIEFNEYGDLEDVEIDVKEKTMTAKIHKEIAQHFKGNHKKYRWLKIQEQYNYDKTEDALDFIWHIMEGQIKKPPFYEIVAEVKKNRSFVLKEYNFDANGKKIAERDIDPESYAHVLY
jgi:hypothetical protein